MKRTPVMIYMALLMILMFAAGAVMTVGDAQARIAGSTTLYHTVLMPQSHGLTSDCLVSEGNQVVLLGEIGSGEWIDAEFTLEAKEPVISQLVWDIPEDVPVEIQVDFVPVEGEGSLDENNLLNMEAGSEGVVILTVTAAEEIPAAQIAQVQMHCGNLSGIFRIGLIADLPEESEPEVTDPEVTDPEVTDPEITDPEITEPEDPDSGEGSEDEAFLPGDTQLPANGAEVELKTLREFALTGLLPVKAEVSGPADGIRIGLAGEEPLPAMTRYSTDGGDNWYLLYAGGYIDLDGVPEDGEEVRWLLLLDLSRTELQEDSLLCLEAAARLEEETAGVCYAETVPRMEQTNDQKVQILRETSPEERELIDGMLNRETPAEPQEGEEPEASSEPTEPETGETMPGSQEEGEPEASLELTEPGTGETMPGSREEGEPEASSEPAEPGTGETIPESEEEEEPAVPVEPETGERIGAFFRVPLPIGWAESTELRCQAEMLGMTEDGTIGYIPVNWDPQGLNAATDSENGALIVYLGENAPTAGTYRLTLECLFEGICFHQEQMTFFVNYSTRSEMQSDEVPDNE